MSTTTIRLDDELKSRVSALAKEAGTTPHAFMLDAIERAVDEAEDDAEFHRRADESWAEYQRTGEYYDLEDIKVWLRARVAGQDIPRPVVRKAKA
jgi:predicted transcriptional regulator